MAKKNEGRGNSSKDNGSRNNQSSEKPNLESFEKGAGSSKGTRTDPRPPKK